MRIAFLTRSTLYDVPGGDTVQVLQTVKQLRELGTGIDINLTNDKINYFPHHLFHFINITRPSDILFHIAKTKKPFALSHILIDYSEYDRQHRKGNSESIFNEIEKAAKMDCQTALQQKILCNYTWQKAAKITSEAHKKIISS